MALVQAIRDYIDLLNTSSDAISTGTDMRALIAPTLWYLLGSLRHIAVYLLSFQWLRDFIQLPLLIPQLSLSVLRGNGYPFESHVVNVLTFLEYAAQKENRFLIGFFNSLFSALPITAAHLLAGRRLLVQGIPAGVAAGSGVVLGQWLFVACVVLGARGLLLPWLSLEPLTYMLGLGLLVNTVYRITHERGIRISKWSDTRELVGYFALSFLLTWCEQTSVFHYLGNLTVGPAPTALDSLSSGWGTGAVLAEMQYLLGFLIGSCVFASLFGALAFPLRRAWIRSRSITLSRLTNQLNRAFLVLLVAFSLASTPYYGVDYLVTKPLGFMPQDKSLEGTMLSPAIGEDTTQNVGRMSGFKSFDTDVTPFDRGLYLQDYQPVPQSFEDLNYQGEYGWTKRASKAVRQLLQTKTHITWHRLLEGEDSSVGTAADAKLPPPQSHSKPPVGPAAGKSLEEEGVVSTLLALEAEIAKAMPGAPLEGEIHSGISSPTQSLSEDSEVENEFLSLFDTGLSPLFVEEAPKPSALEKSLKRRFVENPLYHLLLRLDVDSFLHRQPASHSLSPLEETILSQKRQIIGQYYNTLRQYNRLQNWEGFQTLCHGSKSYANRVYNHQFKGTLKVVRRLFSITIDPEQNVSGNRVLKFDQPLFKEDGRGASSQLHEELPMGREGTHPPSPFLEIADPKPVYAGWDEELRKLVVTNRSLPRSEALYQADGIGREAMATGPYNRLHGMMAKDISFTAWPLSENALAGPRSQSEVPYLVAFESGNDPRQERLAESLHIFSETQDQGAEGGSTWDMSRWPANLRVMEEKPAPMPSTRGGFLWPGHRHLKIGQAKQSPLGE